MNNETKTTTKRIRSKKTETVSKKPSAKKTNTKTVKVKYTGYGMVSRGQGFIKGTEYELDKEFADYLLKEFSGVFTKL